MDKRERGFIGRKNSKIQIMEITFSMRRRFKLRVRGFELRIRGFKSQIR